MFNVKRSLVLAALATLACSRLLGGEAPTTKARPVMERLLFRPDQLPEGCAIQDQKPGEVLPFGKGNPLLSADRKFVETLSAVMFGKESPVHADDIIEALFSVYRSRNEIGVFAWRFRTKDTTRVAEIATQWKHSGSVYRTRNILVFVWHDDPDDPAAPQIRALVKRSLTEYDDQESKPVSDRPKDATRASDGSRRRQLENVGVYLSPVPTISCTSQSSRSSKSSPPEVDSVPFNASP